MTTLTNPVFYTPGTTQLVPSIIDEAIRHPDGILRGRYSRQTLEQLQERYPGAAVGECGAIIAERERRMTTEPEETTMEQFHEMLDCLPPEGYETCPMGTSFKMCERLSGDITQVLAFVQGRYFAFNDRYTIQHVEIIAKVLSHLKSPR